MKHIIPTLILSSSLAMGISITLDYSHDAATDNFFGTNAVAKAALEAAASDISNALTSSLNAISSSHFTGTSGSTVTNLNHSLFYTNPSTGGTETSGSFSLAADEIRIYVGMQELTGSTLGEGGPAGRSFATGGGGFESEFVASTADAESQYNSMMGRGSDVVLGTIAGGLTLGSTTANYNVAFGPLAGNLWFDSDTDNDSLTDSAATLASNWHFDHTTAVAAGKSDFYSVALHEMLHAVGHTDGYNSFDALATGQNWSGSGVIAELGTGTGVLHTDGVHFAAGTMSVTLDGTPQEAAMDPNILVGTRKYLTTLDLALLSDIGFDVIPEPSSSILSFLGLGSLAFRRSRKR